MKAGGSMLVVDEWLERARQDLRLAQLALGEGLTAGAAFHVQQGAEKALKALLIRQGVRPPRSHDLQALAMLVDGAPPPFTFAELAEFSSWAASGRYPGFDESLPSTAAVNDAAGRLSAWLGTVTR